mgnify:CR=1 FL=1
MKQVDKGILIHRHNYSESSLIITFYTYKNGVQKYISKGIKKKSGNLIPLGLYELSFYKKPSNDLGSLSNITQIKQHYAISSNPLKQITCFFIADLLRQTQKTQTEDIETFIFISNYIDKLDNEKDLNSFVCIFLLEYLDFLGITPLLENKNANCFDIEKGVFIYHNKKSDTRIINEAVNSIINFYKYNKDQIKYSNINNSKEILTILLKYLSIHIPNFDMNKSIKIIREIIYE